MSGPSGSSLQGLSRGAASSGFTELLHPELPLLAPRRMVTVLQDLRQRLPQTPAPLCRPRRPHAHPRQLRLQRSTSATAGTVQSGRLLGAGARLLSHPRARSQMNVYMRRTARLYEFERTSRVPNGAIFFVHSLHLVRGQMFLPPWRCHIERQPWRLMGACCCPAGQQRGTSLWPIRCREHSWS